MAQKGRTRAIAVVSVLAAGLFTAIFAFDHARTLKRPTESTLPGAVVVPTNGKIVRLLVRDGDFVKKGQPIAVLDSSGYQADLKRAEAQLQQLQAKTQNAITPMPLVAGISGMLPRSLPKLQTPNSKPKTASSEPQTPKSKPNTPNPKLQTPTAKLPTPQEVARDALAKAAKDLADATAAVAVAQAARDALRPKITQAEVDATEAATKADTATQLFAAGVISANRSAQLIAGKTSTQKTLDDLQAQAAAADQALADSRAHQQSAQAPVDEAAKGLSEADDRAGKAAAAPFPPSAPRQPTEYPVAHPESSSQPSAAHKPTRQQAAQHPAVARLEAPRAIPVKVFVNQQALQTAQPQIAELQRQIELLRERIAECTIVAPVSGRVELSSSGTIAILPL